MGTNVLNVQKGKPAQTFNNEVIMPRIKDNDHTKYTVLLSPSELESAQAAAIRAGVSPKVAGNTSAFLRYLVTEFAKKA